MENIKQAVHRLTDHLQLVLGYMETEQYGKALAEVKTTIKELRGLATALSGIVVAHSLPKDSVVVVPHGTRVVSHDDVTVDIPPDGVQIVKRGDVRPGQGRHNPKTK